MASEASAPPEPPPKRRKITESCGPCRLKKTRCDSQRPACSPCIRKGFACEYSRDSSVVVHSSTLSDILARLSRLEQIAPGGWIAPVRGHADRSGGEASQVRYEYSYENEHQALRDSTTTRFIEVLRQAAGPVAPLQPMSFNGTADRTTTINAASLVLPERAIADVFLESYKRHVYPLFPVLHMPTFQNHYELVWQQAERSDSCSLGTNQVVLYATLNMVFALGCLNNTYTEPQSVKKQADIYYRRARQLVPLDAIDTVTLETVLYSLLTTHYLLSTTRSNRCHAAIGVAIRAAQSLKLDIIGETAIDQRDREMAKRVWHSCVMIERLVCSLFGRKVTSFADNIVLLPEAIDDEYLSDCEIGSQPPNLPSVLHAFIVSIKLFDIIEDARWIVLPSEHVALFDLTTVLQLNERIDRIQDSLPAHLQRSSMAGNGTYGSRDDVFVLQRDAIMIRTIHLRFLLMRPSILAAAREHMSPATRGTSTIQTAVRLRSEICRICVQAAMDAIDILETNLFSPIRVMGCIALSTAFSAATVLVAASLVPELEERYQLPGTRVSRALNILTNHRWQVDGVASAKEQLEQLVELVRAVKSQRRVAADLATAQSASEEPVLDMQSEAFLNFDLDDPIWSLQWTSTSEFFG